MEDSGNLKTASTYINNLLLARGLLRNGTPIDFVALATAPSPSSKPDNTASPGGETGKTDVESSSSSSSSNSRATLAAQTMNLVHDLILRRDKDQERQEQIAQTLYTLRTDTAERRAEIEKLSSRNRALEAQLVSAQANTRSARTALQSLESSARLLREDVARAKTTLHQVRSQCANDVRKRDVQIQRLKSHLSAQQRGAASRAPGSVSAAQALAPSCEIVSGPSSSRHPEEPRETGPSLEDVNYTLKQDTTDFLTQLSASLSDENDTLIRLIRRTLATLRELQGMPLVQQANKSIDHKASMLVGSSGPASDGKDEGTVHVPTASCDALSKDVQHVLDSLRDLLTNPSFAPIEEVHTREEEIQRLRDGWEKMEIRWREAVHLMNGWRRRMLSGGNSIGLEELKLGLKLGEGLKGIGCEVHTGVPSEPLANSDDEFEDELNEAAEEDAVEQDLPEADDLPEMESCFGENDNNDDLILSVARDHLGAKDSKALREATGNIEGAPQLSTHTPEKGQENVAPLRIEKSVQPLERAKPGQVAREASKVHNSSSNSHKAGRKAPPHQPNRRTSTITPRAMTVEEKLEFAAAEARRVSAASDQRSDSPAFSSRSSSPDLVKPVSRIPLDESTQVDVRATARTNASQPTPSLSSSKSQISHGGNSARGKANAKPKSNTSQQAGRQATSSTEKKHARSASTSVMTSAPARVSGTAGGSKPGNHDRSNTTHQAVLASTGAAAGKALTAATATTPSTTNKAAAATTQQKRGSAGSSKPAAAVTAKNQTGGEKRIEEQSSASAPAPALAKTKRTVISVEQKLAAKLHKKSSTGASGGRRRSSSRRRSTLRPDELDALMGLK